jgi:hypothetical protein
VLDVKNKKQKEEDKMCKDPIEIFDEGEHILRCIEHCSLDALNDPKATKNDLIKDVLKGIKRWEAFKFEAWHQEYLDQKKKAR